MSFRQRVHLEKRICDAILAVALLIAYFLLAGIRVSPGNYIFRSQKKEIDWTIFHIEQAQPKESGQIKLPQPDDRLNRQAENTIIIPSIESIAAEFTSTIDLPKKSYRALAVPQTDRVTQQMQFAQQQEPRNESDVSLQQTQYASLLDVPSQAVGQVPQISVEVPADIPLDLPVYRLEAPGRFNDLNNDKAIPEPDVIKIELRPEDVRENEKDLSPIIHELIQWMQSNQASFSSVFRRFLNYEAGNLTSQATFEINSKRYELFLLCKINILEVRICLIESNNLILLIDSGLKEKSNYLRLGSVKRSSDGSIASFISQQKTPTPNITNNFYKIFLSWWDDAKEGTLK